MAWALLILVRLFGLPFGRDSFCLLHQTVDQFVLLVLAYNFTVANEQAAVLARGYPYVGLACFARTIDRTTEDGNRDWGL